MRRNVWGPHGWHLPRHQGHRRRNRERPDGLVPDLKNVLAVAISVTADSPSGNGFISAVPTTVSPPMPTSTANYQDGRSITGMSLVPVDASGNIRIYSLKNTHFQVDILGFTAINAVGGLFSPVTPFRAVDTRW